MSTSVQALVVQEAQRQGVDPNLALAVAQTESGFNQSAVSPAGAIGVMQLMPQTAAQLGVDPTDTQQNIQGGIAYLRQMLAQFGDPAAALAAYNWGPGNVQKAQAAYGSGWLAHAPSETQSYVGRILGAAAAAPASSSPGFAPSSSMLTVPSSPSGADWGAMAIGVGLILGAGYVLSEA